MYNFIIIKIIFFYVFLGATGQKDQLLKVSWANIAIYRTNRIGKRNQQLNSREIDEAF